MSENTLQSNASRPLHAYRARELSPVAVTQSVLDHIARWEPHLCASYLLRPERALEQARQSEARWQRGEPCGALDGVPVTIKENIATRGDPIPLGILATDAPPAARLRATDRSHWHRHWWLLAPASGLVRHLQPQTQPGAHSHRPHLHRARSRPHDTHRGRLRAVDAGAEPER